MISVKPNSIANVPSRVVDQILSKLQQLPNLLRADNNPCSFSLIIADQRSSAIYDTPWLCTKKMHQLMAGISK